MTITQLQKQHQQQQQQPIASHTAVVLRLPKINIASTRQKRRDNNIVEGEWHGVRASCQKTYYSNINY